MITTKVIKELLMQGVADGMTIEFVEDNGDHLIHVWLKINDFDVGVICERRPSDGLGFTVLDEEDVQDEWFGRLCDLCFVNDEVGKPVAAIEEGL